MISSVLPTYNRAPLAFVKGEGSWLIAEDGSRYLDLGAGIAVAFVATIYGVGFANLVFLPIAKKLAAHILTLTNQREMFVDGLVGIANGDNPRIIASRMQGYVV